MAVGGEMTESSSRCHRPVRLEFKATATRWIRGYSSNNFTSNSKSRLAATDGASGFSSEHLRRDAELRYQVQRIRYEPIFRNLAVLDPKDIRSVKAYLGADCGCRPWKMARIVASGIPMADDMSIGDNRPHLDDKDQIGDRGANLRDEAHQSIRRVESAWVLSAQKARVKIEVRCNDLRTKTVFPVPKREPVCPKLRVLSGLPGREARGDRKRYVSRKSSLPVHFLCLSKWFLSGPLGEEDGTTSGGSKLRETRNTLAAVHRLLQK